MIKIDWDLGKLTSKSIAIGQVGGIPNIKRPESYPSCKVCGSELTYFFTIDVSYIRLSIYCSIFYCVHCTGSTAPDLPLDLSSPVSIEECNDLQREYRLLFHRDEIWEGDIISPLVPRTLYGRHSKLVKSPQSHIAGRPSDFELDSYDCGEFIFQVREASGLKFPVLKNAPPQQAYVLFSDDEEFPDRGYYILINEIPLYFYMSQTESDDPCGFIVTGRF